MGKYNISRSKVQVLVLMAVFFVFGLVIVGIGIYNISVFPSKYDHYIETQGTVIGYRRNPTSRESVFVPIVEYYVDGERYTVIGEIYTSNLPKVGTTEIVKYDPNDPSEAVLPSVNHAAYKFMIAIGSFFSLLAIFGAVMRLRDKGNKVNKSSASGIDDLQQF